MSAGDCPGERRCEVGSSFTHLHVHTEFSMLDGAARLDELVAKAVSDGQPALRSEEHTSELQSH